MRGSLSYLKRDKKNDIEKQLVTCVHLLPRKKSLQGKFVTCVHLTAHSIASTAVSVSAACCKQKISELFGKQISIKYFVSLDILMFAIARWSTLYFILSIFSLANKKDLDFQEKMERKLHTFGVHCAVLVNKSAGSFSPLSHFLIFYIKRIFHIFTSIKNHFVRKTDSPGAASVNCTFTRAHLTELQKGKVRSNGIGGEMKWS